MTLIMTLNSAQILLVSRNHLGNPSLLMDIHVSCDISERAYGTCIYACNRN